MNLSEQLEECHNSGDFGKGLEGLSERAKELEDALEGVTAPEAWINSEGSVLSHSKYLEYKKSKNWRWVIKNHYSNAIPLYRK